jgi:hypothetical protein
LIETDVLRRAVLAFFEERRRKNEGSDEMLSVRIENVDAERMKRALGAIATVENWDATVGGIGEMVEKTGKEAGK